MLALAAVVAPRSWLAWGHAWCGLGELPDMPVVGYLARSASALYALHGLMVVYMSGDVQRYWGLIRFLAMLALLHGLVMWGIDIAEGMPRWWAWLEGPSFAATGLIVLLCQRSCSCVLRTTTSADCDGVRHTALESECNV